MESSGRLAYLDGVRGIAILAVLAAHFGRVQFVNAGQFGVDLFFALSGLLMSRILFEQRMPLGMFYRRRISRIMPAFFAFLLGATILAAIRGPVRWQEVMGFATFTRTYLHPSIWSSSIPAQNLWSLNVEEHCYLLLAGTAAIAMLRRHVPLVLFSLAALTLIAFRLHMKLGDTSPYFLNTECAATPLLVSAGYRSVAKEWPTAPWVAPLAFLIAVLCYLSSAPWYLQHTLSPVLFAVFVNHIGDTSRWLLRTLSARWLCWFGVLSYSIYLWQQPFYRDRTLFPLHSAVLFAVLAGCASFYVLENPARKWLNAHWGAPKARAQAAEYRVADRPIQ